ncbi:MAG: hypothetical protein NTY20_06205 [Candidatus Aenigmarchaeota archaeon]|nr:hypothetical protein [Candidatus Aenigmarchaeota archaeon]
MKGISGKEIEVISYLEMSDKFFFTREDIKRFFKDRHEMKAFVHRLKEKGRIIRLNRDKYYLIPVRAFRGHWSEHPFIIIDEVMSGRDYYIGGKAAANYWGFTEQLPTQIEVYSTRKQGTKRIFGFTINFRRARVLKENDFVQQKTKGHDFLIASKGKARKWAR